MINERRLSEFLSNSEWAHKIRIHRSRAEQYPNLFKEIVNLVTHGTLIDHPLTDFQIEFQQDLVTAQKIFGRESIVFEMLRKIAQRVEFNKTIVQNSHRMSKDKIPAFDPSLINICTAQWVLDLFKKQNWGPCTRRLINRCSHLSTTYLDRLEYQTTTLSNNSSCGFEWNGVNVSDIIGIAFWNDDTDTRYPYLVSFLKIIDNRKWNYVHYTNHGVSGITTVVPDNEGGSRIVFIESPRKQRISKNVAKWLGYIARNIDANGTTFQMKWINRALARDWINSLIIISADMKKYSDTLLRKVILDILEICELIPNKMVKRELDSLWSGDVWDKVRCNINGCNTKCHSDTVKQGQYSIFDAMTIVNLFMQCVVYDHVNQSNTEVDYIEDKMKVISRNSAVGDDTVMAFEIPKGVDPTLFADHLLDCIKDAFSYLGVKLNNNKTKILIPGIPGYIDFVKRVVTHNGIVSYINPNVLSKGEFDDYIDEYRRLLEENSPYAQKFGEIYLGSYKEKFDNLHRINGGIRISPITLDDLKLFEYRFNKYRDSYKIRDPNNLSKSLQVVKTKVGLLSSTPLSLWLDNPELEPSESRDVEIIDNILNTTSFNDPVKGNLNDLLGKTWDEVQNMEIITWMEESIRDIEHRTKKKDKHRDLYRQILDIDLNSFELSGSIWIPGAKGGTLSVYNEMKKTNQYMINYHIFIAILSDHGLYDPNVSYHQSRPLIRCRWKGNFYVARLYRTFGEVSSNRLSNRSCYPLLDPDLFNSIISNWLPSWSSIPNLYQNFISHLPSPDVLDSYGHAYLEGYYDRE